MITSKYKEPVMDVLFHFRLSDLFDVIVTGYEVKRHKPVPDIVIEAAKRLSMDTSQYLVVGDSVIDVQAGKHACSHTIALVSNAEAEKQLRNAKPTLIAEHLSDILTIL